MLGGDAFRRGSSRKAIFLEEATLPPTASGTAHQRGKRRSSTPPLMPPLPLPDPALPKPHRPHTLPSPGEGVPMEPFTGSDDGGGGKRTRRVSEDRHSRVIRDGEEGGIHGLSSNGDPTMAVGEGGDPHTSAYVHTSAAYHSRREPSSTARLEKAVLGGLCWCSTCRREEESQQLQQQAAAAARAPGQVANDALPRGLAAGEVIPLSFPSVERYVAVMEPLLHEEARAGVQVRGLKGESYPQRWDVGGSCL